MMDIIGTIIAFTIGIALWILFIFVMFTSPGMLLVVGGVLLASWIVADSLFHIR